MSIRFNYCGNLNNVVYGKEGDSCLFVVICLFVVRSSNRSSSTEL